MNTINNSYLYNQTTREKIKRNLKKNNEVIPARNCIYDYQRINYFQPLIPELSYQNKLNATFTKTKKDIKTAISSEINEIKSYKHKNNDYFYSSMNLNNAPLNNKEIPYDRKNDIVNNNNNEIQSYTHFNKKSKYQRCNSLAYIKKRPKDLIKIKSSEKNNSLTSHKFLRNTIQMKGRCLSCTNIKNNINILNNKDIGGNEINNNTSKKPAFPATYPFAPKKEKIETDVNKFSMKKQDKILNKNIFANSIFNVINKNLANSKKIFFKKIKETKKAVMYEVSFEEYKFLEELKGLGVTNTKELNSLLKDIFVSIKGNEGINSNNK